MKKRVGILIIVMALVLLILPIILAQDESQKVEEAYRCLEAKVNASGGACSALSSVEEKAFSLLALSYNPKIQKECKDSLNSQKDSAGCWPKGSCELKETALSILALSELQEDVQKSREWLLNQKMVPKDLIWFLEIDQSGADTNMSCTLSYDNSDYQIVIGIDKKISGNPGVCFAKAYDDYWLQISDSCYEKNFTLSCSEDFISALLYKEEESSTIYVSSRTESAPAEGKIVHIIKSWCFHQPGSSKCNYEGSLWAASVLGKLGEDVSLFLPYLEASSSNNQEFFPSAFLYMMTENNKYFQEIMEEHHSSGYWRISSSPNNKFYDTALGLFALRDVSASQKDDAKTYLLRDDIQDDNGCWRNVRDTAFILYATWPKAPILGDCEDLGYTCKFDCSSDETEKPYSCPAGKICCGLASQSAGIDYCEDFGYYCVSSSNCMEEDVLDNFLCAGMKICCKEKKEDKSCSEQGGIVCSEDKECTSIPVPASDTTDCCLTSCVETDELPGKTAVSYTHLTLPTN